MTVAVYLPLLLGLPLALAAPWIAARGAPGPAAWALSLASAIAAACSTWSLALLALTMLDDVPPLAALDNHPALELPEPVPGPVAFMAALVLIGGAARLGIDAHRRVTTHRRLRAIGDARQQAEAGMVVADWETPMAVAIPGTARRRGHLLVTTGILRLLDAGERRVVLAHEHAHLVHRHHRLTATAAAAAALNPLLIPVRDAVAYLVERWADEDAAAEVGDRGVAARAVARAALAASGSPASAALGIDGGVVVRRVQALTQPAPTPHCRRLAIPVLLSVILLGVAAATTEAFVHLAQAWL
ncbi:M48 family metalloprotease [Actinoplanes sp. TBRC 11911]|uniref:M48 family metalloprotease n=1 Tax=Actinoplanes sp. TBRC 11911 TaxID=2729386 RepID=UPI00145CEA01|nr:M48 family metalloprotease [Actinoplanes sp. TBRC 11911]NMO53719.1 M48 family metalloprotease [Actinoplanes sp. TBRC 11911]